MIEYYIFAGFIGLMVFALVFWFKRTPRAKLPRKEADELAENEAKLFKLYRNLEDMMDSFESYVEQQSAQFKGKSESMAATEKRVDELAGRVEAALRNTDDRWGEASAMVDRAELLATELAGRISRNIDDLERRQQLVGDEIDRVIDEKLQAAREEAGVVAAAQQPLAAEEQPKTRRLEPIIARPAEESRQQLQDNHSGSRDLTTPAVNATAAATEIPFTPTIGKAHDEAQPQPSGAEAYTMPDNEMHAQLIKKLAEAKKSRQTQMEKRPEAAAHFETTVPEFDIVADMAATAGGSGKFSTYSRPAPMQKAKTLPGNDQRGETGESRKQQVLDLYKEGMSAEEISRHLGVAKGAISFILDLQGKLQ